MPILASARRAAAAAATTNRIISSTCYSTNGGSSAPFLTLSFSGAGHLLSYHLGVAASLHRASANKRKQHLPIIKAVSGSSSGAIAATVFVRLPHRIEEYADTFLSEGGRAFAILKDMLHDEERRLVSAISGVDGVPKSSRVEVLSPGQSAHHNTRRVGGRSGATAAKTRKTNSLPPSLHVATTKCETGQLHMFDFRPVHPEFRTISAAWTNDELLQAVEASCRIPQSFHPADVLESPLSGMMGAFGGSSGGNGGGSASTYPDGDGICINDKWYVDGGIAAPAPPTPFDDADKAIQVIISPISGSPMGGDRSYFGDDEMNRHRQTHRISPSDDTRRLLPFELRLRGGLSVFPSMQNLRALGISAGAASKDDLMRWYDAGREDGEAFVNNLQLW